MFPFRNNRQPEMHLEAELFLQSERGRIIAELEGVETTPNRNYIEEPLTNLRTAAQDHKQKGDLQSFMQVVGQGTVTEIAMVFNTFHETFAAYTEHREQRKEQRRNHADPSFVQTCRGMGRFLMHGIKVRRWNEKYTPGDDVRTENVVAHTVVRAAEQHLGDRARVKRVARWLMAVA